MTGGEHDDAGRGVRPTWTEIKILVSFILVASLFVQWMPTYANSQFDLTRSIVEEQSFDISSYVNNTGDHVLYQNGTYTDKAPGASFLATPLYAAYVLLEHTGLVPPVGAGTDPVPVSAVYAFNPIHDAYLFMDPPLATVLLQFIIILFLSILPTAIVLALLFRVLLQFGFTRRFAAIVSLLFGFGTILLFHSTVFLGDPLAMLFAFASWYLIIQPNPDRRRLLIAGGLAAFAAVVEYYAAIFPVLLTAYVFTEHRERMPAFVTGGVIGVLPLFAYNLLTTGNPFIPVIAYQQLYSPSLTQQALQLCETCLPAVLGFTPTPQFVFPNLLRLLVYPSRGLFFYSPILLFAIPGIVLLYRERSRIALLIMAVFAAFLVFNAGWLFWFGGPVLGPRYLVSALPFLALPLAYGIRWTARRRTGIILITVLALVSLYVAFLGFNGTQMTPTPSYQEALDIVFDPSTTWSPAEKRVYYEKVFSPTLLMNPLPRYHLKFLANGPTSSWIEILAGIPEYALNSGVHTDEDLAVLMELPGSFLVLQTTFLPLVLALAFLLVVWRRNLFDALHIPKHVRIPLMLVFLIILFAPVVTEKPVFWGDGWWTSTPGSTEDNRFIAGDATLRYASATNRSAYLAIDYFTYYPPIGLEHNVSITVNGRTTSLTLIGAGTYYHPVRLRSGGNDIRIRTDPGCMRPALLPNETGTDKRCIGMRINDVSVVSTPTTTQQLVLGKNWVARGDNMTWMTEASTMYIDSPRDETLLLGFIFAYNASRNVSVTINGQPDNVLRASPGRMRTVKLPLRQGLNRIVFDPVPGCEPPHIVHDGAVQVCLNAALIDLDMLEHLLGPLLDDIRQTERPSRRPTPDESTAMTGR